MVFHPFADSHARPGARRYFLIADEPFVAQLRRQPRSAMVFISNSDGALLFWDTIEAPAGAEAELETKDAERFLDRTVVRFTQFFGNSPKSMDPLSVSAERARA